MRSHHPAIQALNAEVVLVSFGTAYWVRVWQEETGAPFLLLLDSQRTAYKAYGLERSFSGSWGFKNLWYYFKAVLARRPLPQATGEDTHQLAGDFIIDPQGILRLVHASQDPTDRPPVDQLLATLRELDSPSR